MPVSGRDQLIDPWLGPLCRRGPSSTALSQSGYSRSLCDRAVLCSVRCIIFTCLVFRAFRARFLEEPNVLKNEFGDEKQRFLDQVFPADDEEDERTKRLATDILLHIGAFQFDSLDSSKVIHKDHGSVVPPDETLHEIP